MIIPRHATERGHTRLDWLDSRHTFSFGHYRDPAHMGFRSLRVINDDRVVAGAGFGTHGHRDMEIISYVLSGSLAHRDSLGTGSTITPGEIQRMSAGTGIEHSEFNASREHPVHFLQIWILPERSGLEPGYEQRRIDTRLRRNQFALIADRAGTDGALTIHQDVKLYNALLDAGHAITRLMDPKRFVWLHVASGTVRLNEHPLTAGDGVAVVAESSVTITAEHDAELLLFDLA
jgi:redox-sensitive bicupin YhaK (pirin superfamily)